MKTTRYAIQLNKKPRASAAPPRGKPDFSFAVLADLHDARLGRSNSSLLKAVEEADVCAVLSAGDLVTVRGGPAFTDNGVKLIRRMAKRWPVYLANGNHEMRLKEWTDNYPGAYESFVRDITGTGAVYLDNETAFITQKGMRIAITGLSLEMAWYDRLHRRELKTVDLERMLENCHPKDADYSILLAHHPEYFPVYANWDADLILSGHLHGGMIRVPFLGGLVGGGINPFPKYDLGSFERNGKRMIVSAGLASHTIKLRINNPPELVVLDFYL